MPVTTICVQPISREVEWGVPKEGELQVLTSHPAEMGYSPKTRRRCGLANVLCDLTDDQIARLQTLYRHVEQVTQHTVF